jgi:hypothetical protein
MGSQAPQPWDVIKRDGRKFSMGTLDWVIDVAPTGEVLFVRGGKKTPLGKVSGLTDDNAAWFGALIVAGPMVQHALTLEVGDQKLAVHASADGRSWDIVDDKGAKLATREREDPAPLLVGDKPAWDPTKIKVTQNGKQFDIAVDRSDDKTKESFDADAFTATLEADGTIKVVDLSAPKKAPRTMKLGGYQACAAHDRAVAALLWAAFATKNAHAVNFSAPASGATK